MTGVGVLLFLLTEENGPGNQGRQLLLEEALHRQIVLRHQIGGGGLFVGLAGNVAGGEDNFSRLTNNGDDLFQHK